MLVNTTTRLSLPFWPSSLNNLKWSADNLIAVGGGESLAILVPRLRTTGPNNFPWDHTLHRVSYFNYDEIPMLEALSSANRDLGEELSLRHITELEWSSPGLGRFGSCLLAILHSNHVLALWECTGRPEMKDDWRRCTIVNHAVQQYYADHDSDETVAEAEAEAEDDDGKSRAKHEKERVRQRITAFAWAPPLRRHDDALVPGLDQYLTYGTQHLAVSTEAGDIMILSVSNPYTMLEIPCQDRTVEVLQCYSMVQGATESLNGGPNARNGHIPTVKSSGASHIAWSDWTTGHDHQGPADDSRLAFITRGRLFAGRVLVTHAYDGQLQFQCTAWDEVVLPQSPDLKGPLSFLARLSTVVLFSDDAVLQADVVLGWSQDHHLDGRWDEPSATTVTVNGEGQPNLHIATHLSSSSAKTSRIPLTLENRTKTTVTTWQYAIQESRALFSHHHGMGGNVQERVWGMTASPLEDCIAISVSLLPSDSPAHIIQSHQKSEVLISTEWESIQTPWSSIGLQTTPGKISAETLLYSLRQYLARNGPLEDVEDWKRAQFEVIAQTLGLDQLHHITGSKVVPEEVISAVASMDTTRDGLEFCVRYLRARIYYDALLLQDRLSRLITIAVQEPPKLQFSRQACTTYVDIILSLPVGLTALGGTLSHKIASALNLVKRKLEDQTRTADIGGFNEQCSVCTQDIRFESLRWSRCAGGHQFPRCSLTFLSILEPGMSKSCRICGVQSLNEYVLPEMSTSGEVDGTGVEPQASLARVLLAACDKCIFCGGKFVA